jgi:D-alanyl-D-alanine carboxypeptidase/Family of unknown function (DUF5715)
MIKNPWATQRKPRRRTTYSLATLISILILTLIGNKVRVWNIHRENNRELEEIASTEPQSGVIFKNFIAEIESKTDWNVAINSGLRSEDEQVELKKKNSKNATPERSKHVKGKAIDINLYQKGWIPRNFLKKSDTKAAWEKTGVPDLAKQFGLKWGGDFKTYHDPVHFEVME